MTGGHLKKRWAKTTEPVIARESFSVYVERGYD
jgi:hypothetical protein